nr:gibberellin-regulated protein 5-like [Ipomoea trifida]
MAVSSRIQYTFTLFFVASLAVFDISMAGPDFDSILVSKPPVGPTTCPVSADRDVQQHLTRRAVWSSATCAVTGAIVSHLVFECNVDFVLYAN